MKNLHIPFFCLNIFYILLISNFSLSQEDSLLLDLYVVDTNTYNGETIIVFNDGSWEYQGEFQIVEKVTSTITTSGFLKINESDLFSKNWKNHKTFSLDYNCSKMIDSISINTSGAFLPVECSMISGFKLRWGRWHNGNDYAAVIGTPIKSTWEGKVRYAQFNEGGFGNLVIIRHNNGLETYYAHLSKIDVKINDFVTAGQIIGKTGNTGHSTGPHLHFECRFMDNPINPNYIFNTEKLLIHKNIFISKEFGKTFSIKELFNLTPETISKTETLETKILIKKKRRTASNID